MVHGIRWWEEYSDRKNDEEDEHVADSLLYDRNHLPRTAPPPECVHEYRKLAAAAKDTSEKADNEQGDACDSAA